MLTVFTLRASLLRRLMRACVVWFALLALALPSFGSVRGLCCEHGLAKSVDCCAAQLKTAAMTMAGMHSSQMESMMGADALADSLVLIGATDCAPAPDSELPAFVVGSEADSDGSPLVTREIHPALAWNFGAGESSSVPTALHLVEGTPPRFLLSEPHFLVLRI